MVIGLLIKFENLVFRSFTIILFHDKRFCVLPVTERSGTILSQTGTTSTTYKDHRATKK